MKKFTLTLSSLLWCFIAMSQLPVGFSYQAVVRNAEGQPLVNQEVSIQISLTSNDGTVTHYAESHTITTSPQGVITLTVGEGMPVSGEFSTVPWSVGEIFMKVEVDPLGGESYVEMGVSKLQSVPYALFAADGQGVTQVPGTAGQSLTHSGTDWVATSNIYTNTGDSVGVGTTVPEEKLHVIGNIKASGALVGKSIQVGEPIADPDQPLFVVRNSDDKIVFAVYESGVRMYVDSYVAKAGSKGGFAVGGLTQSKAGEEYLRVTPDSVRIYIDTTTTTGKTGSKGGFAVGGLTQSKGTPVNLLKVTADSTRIYVSEGQAKSGSKGGFAVGGLTQSKAIPADLLYISPDSARIYIDTSPGKSGSKGGFAVGGLTQSKGVREDFLRVTRDSTRVYINDEAKSGSKGGFAVGGLTQSKGTSQFFNVATGEIDVISEEARILWYPLKNAFLAGLVNIDDPLNVGENSMAIGYKTIAKGDYSQALGYLSQANGLNSTAIGNIAVVDSANSYAFGNNTYVGGKNSYALGDSAKAIGENSYAIGAGAQALGKYSFSLGSRGILNVFGPSMPLGGSITQGDFSYAFGPGNFTEGLGSIAVGAADTVTGQFAIAIGTNNHPSGMGSRAIGDGNTSSGVASTTIGNNNTASDTITIAMGYGTTASANFAISMGLYTSASGEISTSMGNETKAKSLCETAIGSNNDTTYSLTSDIWIETEPIFIVGNGEPNGESSNALMVLKNGNTGIGGYPGTTGTNVLAIKAGNIPDASLTNGVILYADTTGGTGAVMKVRDEAGNITTTSPHTFSFIKKSEPMAWSYYSENKNTGYRINVDMLKAVRKIEELSGEKLVYLQNIETDEILKQENRKESLIEVINNQKEKIVDLEKRISKLESMLNELIK